MEYVPFGEQDRRDFEFEKNALIERISKGWYIIWKSPSFILYFFKWNTKSLSELKTPIKLFILSKTSWYEFKT